MPSLQHTASVSSTTVQTVMAERERRATRMVMVMLFTYFVVWTPYAVAAICVLAGIDGAMASPAAVLPVLFAKLSTFTNPVIYVFMNREVVPQLYRGLQ